MMTPSPDDQAFEAGPPKQQQRAARPRNRDDEPDPRPRSRGDDALATVIPYRNVLALTGYYFGVFSLIPVLGLLLGPIALVLGILGWRYVRKNPEAKGTGHAVTAMVLGSITTLAHIAVIVLFFVMSASRR